MFQFIKCQKSSILLLLLSLPSTCCETLIGLTFNLSLCFYIFSVHLMIRERFALAKVCLLNFPRKLPSHTLPDQHEFLGVLPDGGLSPTISLLSWLWKPHIGNRVSRSGTLHVLFLLLIHCTFSRKCESKHVSDIEHCLRWRYVRERITAQYHHLEALRVLFGNQGGEKAQSGKDHLYLSQPQPPPYVHGVLLSICQIWKMKKNNVLYHKGKRTQQFP